MACCWLHTQFSNTGCTGASICTMKFPEHLLTSAQHQAGCWVSKKGHCQQPGGIDSQVEQGERTRGDQAVGGAVLSSGEDGQA